MNKSVDGTQEYCSLKYPTHTSGSASFAQESVRTALKLAVQLEEEWCRTRNEEDDDKVPESIQNIETLIYVIGQDKSVVQEKKASEIFRYLCGAMIYSGAIMCSSLREPTEHNHEQFHENDFTTAAQTSTSTLLSAPTQQREKSSLEISDEIEAKVTLTTLNDLASEIVKEIRASTGNEKAKTKAASAGQIPYLLVSTTKHYQVAIRNGFEVAKSHRSFARKVTNVDADLDDFPTQIIRTSQSHMNSKIPQNLNELILDAARREKLLRNKYITWIRIYPSSFMSARTQIEIDVIDELIYEDPKKCSISQKRLRELAGRDKHPADLRNVTRTFTVEDVIVTYCSNTLFDFWRRNLKISAIIEYKRNESLCQIMQNWSNERIRNYAVRIYRKDAMYIGFSWGTIIDGGYGDRMTVCGSTNILLLALTRGLVKIAQNSDKSYIFMGRQSIEHFSYSTNSAIQQKLNEILTNIGIYTTMQKNKTEERIGRKVKKRYGIVYKNKLRGYNYVATNEGITVKSKPTGFVIFVFLFGLSIFLTYCVIMGIRQKQSDNYEEYIGGMISLPPLLVGICIFIIKLRFPKWEILDIINGRMYTETFTDLTSALRSGKIEATRIIASVDNPKEVFACKGANPFVSTGTGDFKINEKFNVRELQEAGFIFGLDYYANPVVINCLGVVRQIKFPDTFHEDFVREGKYGTTYFHHNEGVITSDDDASDDEESVYVGNENSYNSLQVGQEHSIQPSLVFKIPITNMGVR